MAGVCAASSRTLGASLGMGTVPLGAIWREGSLRHTLATLPDTLRGPGPHAILAPLGSSNGMGPTPPKGPGPPSPRLPVWTPRCSWRISHADQSTGNIRTLTQIQPQSCSGRSGPSYAPRLTVQMTFRQAPDTALCPQTLAVHRRPWRVHSDPPTPSHFPACPLNGFGTASSRLDPHRTLMGAAARAPRPPI